MFRIILIRRSIYFLSQVLVVPERSFRAFCINQNTMLQHVDLRCVLLSAPLVQGVPTKTRLVCSITKSNPHLIYNYGYGFRPKLWFNATGHMTHLFNGVCSAASASHI